jgi:hypothetical protein
VLEAIAAAGDLDRAACRSVAERFTIEQMVRLRTSTGDGETRPHR